MRAGSSGRSEPPRPRWLQDTAENPPPSASRGPAAGGAPSPLLITSGTPSAPLVHVRRPVPSRLTRSLVDAVPRACDGDVTWCPPDAVVLEDGDGGATVAIDGPGRTRAPGRHEP